MENNKTFVITVTSSGEGRPINYTIVRPDGCGTSGQVWAISLDDPLDSVLKRLKSEVSSWNSYNPDNKFVK